MERRNPYNRHVSERGDNKVVSLALSAPVPIRMHLVFYHQDVLRYLLTSFDSEASYASQIRTLQIPQLVIVERRTGVRSSVYAAFRHESLTIRITLQRF
jgi:hypothetical protein